MELELPGFQAYLDALPEPHILIGENYRIVAANKAYLAAFHPGRAVVGQTCHQVSHGSPVPCDQAGETCPLALARRTQRRESVLHRHHTPTGDEFVAIELVRMDLAQPRRTFYLEKLQTLAIDNGAHVPSRMVGRSPAFQQTLRAIARVAPSAGSILLLGETGTGKEMAAGAIHAASQRSAASLVIVDCASVPESLFESELFGHERGAFTGAGRAKPGLVESANGGTLFLDEVGDIPLPAQVKLLRFLESGMFRRVGSTEYRHSDVRVVSATHRDLRAMISAGQFRADLYYRLATFPLRLAPLRERKEDLAALAETYLRHIEPSRHLRLDGPALQRLEQHDFPGNVRELRNILERAAIRCDGQTIGAGHIAVAVAEDPLVQAAGSVQRDDRQVTPVPGPPGSHRQTVQDRLLEGAFQPGDRRRDLARSLGISERSLYRHLRQLRDEAARRLSDPDPGSKAGAADE